RPHDQAWIELQAVLMRGEQVASFERAALLLYCRSYTRLPHVLAVTRPNEAGSSLPVFGMGQFFDYFRAADAEIALLTIASASPKDVGFDTVEAKGIAPDVVLSQLITFVHRTPWSPDVAPTRLLWPPPASSKMYARLPESSTLRDGPILQELSVETRDAL